MTRQQRAVRGIGIFLCVLFLALFAQLNYLQVFRSQALADDARNTRNVERNFQRERGDIVSAEGTVLAYSEAVDDEFKRQRIYPAATADLFANLVGFFSFTYGADGLERQYDRDLAERSRPLDVSNIGEAVRAEPLTRSLHLTVSTRLQQAAQEALGDKKGSIVVLDPRTGAVLAMWSYPSYEPNALASHNLGEVSKAWDQLQSDPAQPMLARAYRELYAPGSTFKVVTTAAGLTAEKVRRSYPVLRQLELPNTDKPLANFDKKPCGGSLATSFRVSCNTTFAQLGLDIGGADFVATAEAFGFGSTPRLDLPTVATSRAGTAATFSKDKPALAQSAIGQREVVATPLQMALVAATIANGGSLMRPYVVDRIVDSDGEITHTTRPKVEQQAISPEIAETIRGFMIDSVARGTGTRAALKDVQVAGKTGTAQTGTGLIHAWMIGFAPAQDPTVAVAVIIESQKATSDSTGGLIAAPILRQMIQAALSTTP